MKFYNRTKEIKELKRIQGRAFESRSRMTVGRADASGTNTQGAIESALGRRDRGRSSETINWGLFSYQTGTSYYVEAAFAECAI